MSPARCKNLLRGLPCWAMLVPLGGCAGPAGAAAPDGGTEQRASFDSEPTGAPPRDFEPVAGSWYVSEVAGVRGLRSDGARWHVGTAAADLAGQAERLFGEKHAEFVAGTRPYAFFPLAVYRGASPAGDVRLSVRFCLQSGKAAQAGGLVFGLKPDGSYHGIRASALEDNLVFFRVQRDRRTILDNVRHVPVPARAWHTLVVTLLGKRLVVELDGQQRLARELEAAPEGRVGLWSRGDTQVLFDDFEVQQLHR